MLRHPALPELGRRPQPGRRLTVPPFLAGTRSGSSTRTRSGAHSSAACPTRQYPSTLGRPGRWCCCSGLPVSRLRFLPRAIETSSVRNRPTGAEPAGVHPLNRPRPLGGTGDFYHRMRSNCPLAVEDGEPPSPVGRPPGDGRRRPDRRDPGTVRQRRLKSPIDDDQGPVAPQSGWTWACWSDAPEPRSSEPSQRAAPPGR